MTKSFSSVFRLHCECTPACCLSNHAVAAFEGTFVFWQAEALRGDKEGFARQQVMLDDASQLVALAQAKVTELEANTPSLKEVQRSGFQGRLGAGGDQQLHRVSA